MRANRWPSALIAVLTVTVAGLLGWQRHAADGLRDEIARQRAQGREKTRLAAVNQQLAAAQATTAELERLRADRAAVTQLRAELDSMRRRARESAQAAPREAPATTPASPTPSMVGHTLAYRLWQNAGQATPAAAMETTLWAAAGGEIDALAGMLAFDDDARRQANTLFAQLPEALRKELSTPERLIALLTAKDVPLGGANIVGQFPTPVDTKVATQIFDATGKQKVAMFSLRADGANWRLVVPGAIVQRYADWLHAPAAAGTEVK